jgi:small-conductance mechanosensitive channel
MFGWVNKTFLDNPVSAWGQALLYFLGGVVILALAKGFLGQRKSKDAEEIKYTAGILFRTLVRKFSWITIFVLGLNLARIPLDVPEDVQPYVGPINTITLLFQIGLWLTAVISLFVQFKINREKETPEDDDSSVRLLGLIGRVFLWVIIVLMILDNVPGIQIDSLIASLGITGIAVALAVQSVLGDLFASITIALDRPFKSGDYITVDDKGGGTVEHIGLRSTQLRAVSGEVIVVSNKTLLDAWVNNFQGMVNRRVSFQLGVVCEISYQKLTWIPEILQQIIESHEKTLFDRVTFKDFGDSALVFEVVYFITTSDFKTYIDLRHEINMAIFKRFEDEGIGLAYPTRTIYLKK